MKLKVCGMKSNISEVAALAPDYLGFIFWEPSPRFMDTNIPTLSETVKKVGVFVNASPQEILDRTTQFQLDYIQLHGQESPAFCKNLNEMLGDGLADTSNKPGLIKVFAIKDRFNFEELKPYEASCDFFLFDTKGKLPGGNGYAFDWEVLQEYPSEKPFFLSGGIGLSEVPKLKAFIKSKAAAKCHAIDVNSRFEIHAGQKSIDQLKLFMKMKKENFEL